MSIVPEMVRAAEAAKASWSSTRRRVIKIIIEPSGVIVEGAQLVGETKIAYSAVASWAQVESAPDMLTEFVERVNAVLDKAEARERKAKA